MSTINDPKKAYTPFFPDPIQEELGMAMLGDGGGGGGLIDREVDDTIDVTDTLHLEGSTLSLALDQDNVSVTDTLTASTQYVREADDTVSVTDTCLPSSVYSRSADDTLDVTDDVDADLEAGDGGVEVDDSIDVTDASLLDVFYERSADEALSTTDTVASGLDTSLVLSDTLDVTDAAAAGFEKVAFANDSIDVTDDVETYWVGVLSVLVSDTPDVTDSLLTETSYVRTSNDSTGINDETVRTVHYSREADDALSVTDASEANIENILPDHISVTDELVTDVSFFREAVDSISVTDESDVDIIILEDTVSVTESLLAETSYVRAGQDDLVVTDLLLPENTYDRSFDATISLTDQLLIETVFPQESITLTEQLAVTTEYTRTLSDGLDVTETLEHTSLFERVFSESLVVSDTVTASREAFLDIILSDTLVLTEAISAEYTIGRSASDFIDISDSVVRDVPFVREASDVLAVSDVAIVGLIQFRTLSESISVTETLLVEPIVGRSVSDTIAVTDALTKEVSYNRTLADTLSLTDEVVVGQTYNKEASDTVSVTDDVSAELNLFQLEVNDTIADVTDIVGRDVYFSRALADTLAVTDSVTGEKGGVVDRAAADTLTITDTVSYVQSHTAFVDDVISLTDLVSIELDGPADITMDEDGYGLTLGLPVELRYDNIGDLRNYLFRPQGGVPFKAQHVLPQVSEYFAGSAGQVVFTGDPNFRSNTFRVTGSDSEDSSSVTGHEVTTDESLSMYDSYTVELLGSSPVTRTSTFSGAAVGDYLEISNGASAGRYRITGFVNPFTVTLDRKLPVVDSANGSLQWSWTSAIQALQFKMDTKVTNQRNYDLHIERLVDRDGDPFGLDAAFFTYGIGGPEVTDADLTEDGVVVVTYDQEMQADRDLVFTGEYEITGPTDVMITKTWSVAANQVALQTIGMGTGAYSLRVNASGTPKDIAGNPIDPVFNEAAFTGAIPLNPRSIFTDKGPIARAPEVVQSGIGAAIQTITEVTLPGAALTGAHVGLYVRLGFMGSAPTSSSSTAGTNVTITDTISVPDSLKVERLGVSSATYTSLTGIYKVTGIVSGTRAKLQASFSLPNPTNGLLYWELLDPNNGEIADDPSEVTVTVNGTVVVPEAVVGLLGQVILPFVPDPSDDVKVDYSWCCEPTVDFRRLNSKEFVLNSWKKDSAVSQTQHKYRYNNVLVRPSDYVALDMLADIAQPKLRELHYRAYERAYTPVLNDPSLLLLNSPTHKIAFPPSQRTLTEEFVTYEATVLPENDSWTKHGAGSASITAGVLTVIDNLAGPFPTGQPIFWTKSVDLTFPRAFAMSWRFRVTDVPTYNGVFSGLAAGYSDETAAYIIGFLEVGGDKKIGLLKRGHGDDPSDVSAWTGGLDNVGAPTGSPVDFDWSVLHSYRVFTDRNGVVRVYVDGDIVETLRVLPNEAPFLEELGSPFDEIQGVFFGSLSREAENESEWDFVRYQIIPTNALQSSPSSFVSYEGSVIPEESAKPWVPIGFHGTETILTNSSLLLDATSATDPATATAVGSIGGDFKGFIRIEPLLTVASQYVMDVDVQLRTHTHGPDPYGLMFAVDDGSYLMQAAFFPDFSTPKVSYGGRSLPEDFSPYAWTALGGSAASMVGRHLRIADTSTTDGKVYFIEDLAPPSTDARILESTTDYFLEFRAKVNSYTVDGSGFAGVFAQTFDSTRAVGMMLAEISGTKYVAFHSDGALLGPSARFAFDWDDDEFHTYRFAKNTLGNLVSLFIDGAFVGTFNYSSFLASAGDAQVSFGSATPNSSAAQSNVDWVYCNAWRARSDQKHFVGLWKGYDSDSLLGYHLPVKAQGRGAQVAGNGLGDPSANFYTAAVAIGDYLVVDAGPNRGVYKVAGISSATTLTIDATWPLQPSLADYRIVRETDWQTQHKYRMAKDSSGAISLYQDTTLLFEVDYNSINLPTSGTGLVKVMTNGLAGVAFGSFSSENLAQSNWDSVNYGITRSPTESRIVPHHQVVNQWNVMESPERLFSAIPHERTSFKSSSTGIAPKKDPDFLENAGLAAFTQLNEGTPLVPSTQTYQVRAPYPTQQYLSVLNSPEDVLNNDGDFVLNDSSSQFRLVVPDDVLYSALDVIEQTTGEDDLIAPFGDECQPTYSGFEYTKETCLTYDGNVLPQNDVAAPTPWVLESDTPGQVTTTISSGVLTYSSTASRTVYKNNTTLPDAPGLKTEAKFKIRVTDDQTLGTGDTKIRLGLSAPGLTVGLAFVTTPLAERYVLVVDLNNGNTLGSINFDYLDGAFHEYLITRDPGAGTVRVTID